MRLRLVHASRANRFMRDILEGIAGEATDLGADAAVVDDVFEKADDICYVVVPHEYFAVREVSGWPTTAQLGRTIALTVEHPGTPWFEFTADQARRCGAIMDINRDSTAELTRRGLSVSHFQLGYSRHQDHWGGAASDRPIDIVYLGSTDDRRDRALALYGAQWWDRRVELRIPTIEPKPEEEPDFVVGARKYKLLSRCRTLVNLHRLDSRALEWVRVLEAMSNGCVVVSEHSVDATPLIPGEHFVSADLDSIGVLTAALLDNPDTLAEMAASAYDFIRTSLPMRTSVETMLELAEDLVRAPRPVPEPHTITEPPRPSPLPPGWPQHTSQIDAIGVGLRRVEHRMRRAEQALARMELRIERDQPVTVDVARTSSYGTADPQVSVLIPLYNHSRGIAEALDSVLATTTVRLEIIVQDDASSDSSLAVVEQWIVDHDWMPARLVRSLLNKGPSATRNDLLAAARADVVFMLDADNGVYPPALDRLYAALMADPGADFVYAPIAALRAGRPVKLISSRPWKPDLLRQGNYIDNMAMLRTASLRAMGGWDPDMFSWEDFQLWARMAEAGRRGTFVPQVLGWYRLTEHSNSIDAALDFVSLWSRIRESAPTIMRD